MPYSFPLRGAHAVGESKWGKVIDMRESQHTRAKLCAWPAGALVQHLSVAIRTACRFALVTLLLMSSLIMCGGKAAGQHTPPDAAGDGGEADAPEPLDGSCSEPQPPGTCATCGGGQWHCGENAVVAQCPDGAQPGGSCSTTPGALCVDCPAAGTGYELSCDPENVTWGAVPISCVF